MAGMGPRVRKMHFINFPEAAAAPPPHPWGGTLPLFDPPYARPSPVSVTQRIAFSALRNASRPLVLVPSLPNAQRSVSSFLPRKRGGDSVHIPRCPRSSPKPRVESLEKQMGKRTRFIAAYSTHSASMRESNNTMTFIRSCFLPSLPPFLLPPVPPARGPGPSRRIGLLELTAICYEN